MSFNVALSGLNAASTDLNVTGNNIANVATTGFKSSRAEFADVYLNSMLGAGQRTAGSGVTSSVSQQMTGGNITSTSRGLDLAIDGGGYFIVNNGGDTYYTRAGGFYTDKDGLVVNSAGDVLQGYSETDASGNIIPGQLRNLQVDSEGQPAQATGTVTGAYTLNSSAAVIDGAAHPFDPADSASYNWSTSSDIYDSLGNTHSLMQYFVKDDNNQWTIYTLINGRNPADPTLTTPEDTPLEFNSTGALIDPSPATVDIGDWVPAVEVNGVWQANGAEGSGASAGVPGTLSLNIAGTRQTNSTFGVNSSGISQDGYAAGQLSGLSVDDSGKLFATYTNGQSKVIGQVVLASFANEQGLESISGTKWKETFASGEPAAGVPGAGLLGGIRSGALEDSNVDLTAQLVNLIVAQRNYQANAKTIETESAISQTIINMR
ncbi:flagellar hook protein FlgE [Pseudomonas indoloxydans]|uniref:Flagellar hook protein FlgE n=1 Tax=Ectopseudomonas oleovorans TaxID=301 RepID=A0A2T5PIT5_ECTOL|nr:MULTISPECIES: flagellar hook protein FlgE [Pseudomonas]MDM9650997.1 flagellar hook protein FlgE [Pseudomonas wenzhouensis]PTU77638.1 flagellar hook protein FlgE [Pseudomonas indoloxydans]